MSTPSLTDLEQAVIARLETRKVSDSNPSGELRLVEAYEGQFEQWVEARTFDSPAALVYISEGIDTARGMRSTKREPTVVLYLAVQNYRGKDEARQGVASASETGTYGLIDLAFDLFAGQTLGLDMAPLLPGEWGTLSPPEQLQGFPFSLYRYEFRTHWVKEWPDDARGDEALGPAAASVPDHVTSRLQVDLDGDANLELDAEHTHEEP